MSLPSGSIDLHNHFLPPVYAEALRSNGFTTLDGGMPVPDWSVAGAKQHLDSVGLAKGILSVSSPFLTTVAPDGAGKLAREINDYAADVRDAAPDRFGFFASLPVPLVEESIAEAERAMDRLDCDGISLPTNAAGLYLGHPRLAPLLDMLAERRALVLVHPTSPCCFEAIGVGVPAPMIEFPFDTTRTIVSLLYSGTLDRWRDIRFLFTHAGGTVPWLLPRIARIGSYRVTTGATMPAKEAISWVRKWSYDTALTTAPHQLLYLAETVGFSQLVYGSDFPFSPAVSVAASVKELSMALGEGALRAISVDNPCVLLSGNPVPRCSH